MSVVTNVGPAPLSQTFERDDFRLTLCENASAHIRFAFEHYLHRHIRKKTEREIKRNRLVQAFNGRVTVRIYFGKSHISHAGYSDARKIRLAISLTLRGLL